MLGINTLVYFAIVYFLLLLLISLGLCCFKSWLNLFRYCFLIYQFITETSSRTVYTSVSNIYDDLLIKYAILFFSFHTGLLINFCINFAVV